MTNFCFFLAQGGGGPITYANHNKPSQKYIFHNKHPLPKIHPKSLL